MVFSPHIKRRKIFQEAKMIIPGDSLGWVRPTCGDEGVCILVSDETGISIQDGDNCTDVIHHWLPSPSVQGEPWLTVIIFLCNHLCSGVSSLVATTQYHNITLTSTPATVGISIMCQGVAGHPHAWGEGDAGGAGIAAIATTDGQVVHSVTIPLIR